MPKLFLPSFSIKSLAARSLGRRPRGASSRLFFAAYLALLAVALAVAALVVARTPKIPDAAFQGELLALPPDFPSGLINDPALTALKAAGAAPEPVSSPRAFPFRP